MTKLPIKSEVLEYTKGQLSVEKVEIAKLVKKTGTPVYLYSKKAFLDQFLELQKALDSLDHLICFAIKANSNLEILKLLKSKGAGVDSVSGGELFRARKAGFSGNKVVFSGVGKTDREIIEAIQYNKTGILSFHVESIEELFRIDAIAKKLKRKVGVALRFNPDVDAKTHPYISTGLKENKFGLQSDELDEAVTLLKGLKHVSLHGLSIHIGSQLLNLTPMQDAFYRLLHKTEKVEKALSYRLKYLDLGGGIGVQYKKEDKPISLTQYGKLIKKVFSKTPYKILLEPGRVISANAGVLVTEVLYRKPRSEKDFLVVDASMTELARPSLYGSHHEIIPVEEALFTDRKKQTTDIVGPVCESSDVLGRDRDLSMQLKRGDLLAILSAGAYGFTMASQYNSRPRPAEVLISGTRHRVIRKAENYADLIHGES
jgi:diaminopimelate decarboxylase